MNIEENRLRSFNSWPTDAPVDVTRLARAGFYATGNLLEAQCHWCHQKMSDWHYGDQIMARHRRMNPLCLFIMNPKHCGNVPLLSTTPTSSVLDEEGFVDNVDIEEIDLKDESNRLATFKNWPNPNISPQSLSKAGFYYLNKSDQVKCAWCKGVMAEWEKNDNAFEEHQRFFPNCPRVQLGPLIEISSGGLHDLGIQSLAPPKKPKFSSLDARLRTYACWPITEIQKPDALAQAGFYYQNVDDHVLCFHCNGGLRSWQKEDDPWFDHARWFPNCQFVKLVKGPQYVTQIQETSQQTPQQNSVQETAEAVVPKQKMTLDEAMSTAPVAHALEVGFDAGCVRNVTQKHMQTFGKPYETSVELMRAVLKTRVDDDDKFNDPSYDMACELTRLFNSFKPESAATIPEATSQAELSANEKLPSSSHQTNRKSSISSACAQDQMKSDPKSDKEKTLLLEEENRKLKDARQCKVCMDAEVGIVFIPCGHLVTCVQCAPGVTQCPLCRKNIKGFIRTFLA